MKKTLFIIAALATLAACSKTEVVDMAPKTAISFGESFVDNATRSIDATLNTSTLDAFKVYGSVTWKENPSDQGNTVNLYSGVEVKKGTPETGAVSSGDWWYKGDYTQYWIEGNAYKFAAIVNGTAAIFDKDANNVDNMPLTISYNAADQKDLLYAEHSVDNYAANTGLDVVKFTFNHLLSKVQFTFKNTMTSNTATNMYTYRVSDIKITNAYMNGTYTIDGSTWAVTTTGTNPRGEVAFGNITNADDSSDSSDAIQVGAVSDGASATSHYSRLLIPNAYTDLKITYTLETLLNNKVIDKDACAANPASITLEAGHAYNFVLSKGNPGEPIKFELKEISDWNPATGGTDTTI